MKLIRHFDGHIVINIIGLMIRIKYSKKYNCPEVKESGIASPEESALRDAPVIISLTSFPERINVVVKTIKTLLTQTMKPDKVVLWLAREQFPQGEDELPEELLNLRQFGLTIDWYSDIRSYKKIIPTLRKYPDAVIITTDDDIYYAPDTVETLYKSYLEHKDEVHTHRCSRLIPGPDGVSWEKTQKMYYDKYRGQASFKNRLTGVGAVLYPPHCFYKDVLNEDLIFKLIPTHDDIWLWAMTLLNGYKTRLVKGYSEPLYYVENSQQFGLCKINRQGAGMSLKEAYERIFSEYPQILEILRSE